MIANLLMRLASFSYQKTAIIGLLVSGLYFLMGYDDGGTVKKQLEALNTKFNEEKKREQQSDASLKEVELVRTTVGELGQQFQTVSNALPRTIEYAEVTRIVDFIARKAGVSIRSRESRPEVNRDYFSEVPIKVTIEGTYSELVYFLSLLAQTVRVMKMVDFLIQMPPSGLNLQAGKLILEGEIVSYKFNAKSAEAGNSQSKGSSSRGGRK
jgi:type IV pilus assembly protein PilO